jgi:SNF2 family DNA or RNA helicase/ubiquinone/menaquinone biosynthesis C-methylase UbiE
MRVDKDPVLSTTETSFIDEDERSTFDMGSTHEDELTSSHRELGRSALMESLEAAPDGWRTIRGLSDELGVAYSLVKRVAELHRDQHPEWFGEYMFRNNNGTPVRAARHYSPELTQLVCDTLTAIEQAPEGWQANQRASEDIGIAPQTLAISADQYRESNPEWFKQYKSSQGRVFEYYSPELLEVLAHEVNSTKKAEDGWKSNSALARAARASQVTVQEIADRYRSTNPEWFQLLKGPNGRVYEHYHPELVATIQTHLLESRDLPPDGWMTSSSLAKQLGVDRAFIDRVANPYRGEHSEWFQVYTFRSTKGGRLAEHYSPELVKLVTLETEHILNKSEGWKTCTNLVEDIGFGYQAISRLADRYRSTNPEWFSKLRSNKGKITEHYAPQLVEIIVDEFSQHELAPEGWTTIGGLASQLGATYKVVHRLVSPYKETLPDFFKDARTVKNQVLTYLHPKIAQEVTNTIITNRNTLAQNEYSKEEQMSLQKDMKELAKDIKEGESPQAQEFKSLLSLFGAERAVDILYQQHPEYERLPVPYVKSALADYLGEFLLVKGGFSLDSLEKGAPFLANTSFKEGLTEVIKNDCLRLLNHLSRMTSDEVNVNAIAEYVAHIRQETADFSNPELEEILDEVEAYYQLLFENIHKPDCFVDQLDNGRLFPDINQRINVQEIAFKHKMLIADDMGTGKSASAIMAKEIIGAKQALIIVPSNVVSVWQDYLSDKTGDDGSQIGYFKEGQEPRVLIVNGLEDLTNASPDDYDYVIISQERLNEKYTDALTDFDYDMLIVDEMHKLKNVSSGKRSENLIKLAGYIEGDGKYLALLSGTPVPNKISDVALTLKLLYPERFGDTDNKKLVSQILSGDMLDLRSLLVPRMQMKSLTENIDMPQLHEATQLVELSDQEKEIYDILIEEDELSASEKLITLRQFAMNPRILDATPSIVGSKATQVGEALGATFLQKDKVVMFVNGYIEGVMRGEDTIIQDLNLPEDVEVLTIDGSVSKERRLEIQSELQAANKKMLLLVSGQTADTGVDFSAAEAVYHYNEPWSVYDKQQQTARVYRPGLESDLGVQTFITEGTIERGIHEYINSKYHAVEKLLRGVPISEIEKSMLQQAETQADPNIEVSPELAKYYFSSWDKMMKIYGHVKEVGEEDFRKFLARYDKDYADSYADLAGSRSYQANVSRLSGSIIREMIQEKGQREAAVRVLDMASGPEVLKRHTDEELAQSVISIDINRQHFNSAEGKKAIGSFVHLPIADKSVDYANLSLALHYTSFAPSKNNYERLEIFKEANRVLTIGGRATISMIYSLSLTDDPIFEETMGKLGLKVVREYTGDVSSGKNFQTQVITLEKVQDCPSDTKTLAKEIGPQGVKALKFKKTDVSLRNSKKIIKNFLLGERSIDVRLNAADQMVLAEEEQLTTEMENLKQRFGKIEEIPKSEIYRSGFSRIFNGKRYVLFKRLDTDAGAVVIR